MATAAVDTDTREVDVTSGSSATSAGRRILLGTGIFGLYLVPAVIAYWHAWLHPTSASISYGAGDAALFTWGLRWAPWAVAHGHNPFIAHIINVPVGVDVAANTAVIGLGLIFAPVTAVWGPLVTLNVCFTLAFALSAGAGYLLLRRFTTWRPAAFAGGLLYGFSPYMVGQGVGHLQLVFVPLPPLIMLVLHELLVRQRGSAVKWGTVLGVLVVLQYLIGSEILATTILFAALTVIVVVVARLSAVRSHSRYALVGLASGVVVALVLLAFPVYEQLLGPAHPTSTIIGYRYYYSALAAPLLPTPLMVFGTHHLKAMGALIGGNDSENGTYLGLPLVLLVPVALVLVRRAAARVAVVMAVIAFILSLGVSFHVGLQRFATFGASIKLPAVVIAHTPLLDQAFPVRYSLFVALFVAVVLAVTLDALRLRGAASGEAGRHLRGGWRGAALPGLVAVVALLPLVPAWPYPGQGPTNVPPYFTTSAVDRIAPGTVALVYPMAVNTNAVAELWQAEANLRFAMVGGYFAVPSTPGAGPLPFFTSTPVEQTLTSVAAGVVPARTAALRSRLRADLAVWKVGAVVAQPVGAGAIPFLTWLVGRPPDAQRGGMVEWYDTRWS